MIRRDSRARFGGPSRVVLAIALAVTLGGCAAKKPEADAALVTGSTEHLTPEGWRQRADALAEQYRTRPDDPAVAVAYAQALRATAQRAQAAAVLQQASMRHPNDAKVLGAYGRALAEAGQLSQALEVLSRAHTPDQPDWRILNAQGAVLDQMGNHAEARRYYETALKTAPDEPAILSNLGLSYALTKDLQRAEMHLRRAAERPNADPKVRQNLGLVLVLRGKYDEARRVTEGVLSPEQVQANVEYFRAMMREQPHRRTSGAQGAANAG